MKTTDFLRQHDACRDCVKWALSIGDDMAELWDELIEQDKHEWLLWTATRPGVFPSSTAHKLACRFVRETPLADGRTVWDLLTDERSRKAVEIASAYADGKATDDELKAARDAARIAACAACAAYADVYATEAAVYGSAYDAANVAAANAAATNAADVAACAACAAIAYDTAYAADCAAYAAAYAACAAKTDYTAALTAAYAAQIKMIAELGNPFKEKP